MARFCSNCGNQLDDNGIFCFKCGVSTDINNINNKKKKKKGLPVWAIILIVVACVVIVPLIFITVIGIITYNVIKDDGSVLIRKIQDEIREDIYDDFRYGTIGDTLSDGDVMITLDNALIYDSIVSDDNVITPKEGKKFMVLFMSLNNVSDDYKYISSDNLIAYEDNYLVKPQDINIIIDDYPKLDAKLTRGMNSKGIIVYEVNSSFDLFEINYSFNKYDDDRLIFRITNVK